MFSLYMNNIYVLERRLYVKNKVLYLRVPFKDFRT